MTTREFSWIYFVLLSFLFFPAPGAASSKQTFWWFTDFHLDIYGTDVDSDFTCAWTPSPQMQSAIQAMKEKNPNPSFILQSGDITHFPGRNSSDLSQAVILDTISAVNTWLADQFPTTSIYPALGNHDNAPSNNFPVDPTKDSTWLYAGIANLWSQWLPPAAIETVKYAGWYSADIKGAEGMRVITMNTNFWTVYNSHLVWNTTIAEEQFTWLEGELAKAEEDGVKVLMNGHHPMVGVHVEGGVEVGSLYPIYQHRYSMIAQKYNETIMGHFAGHDHVDEVRLIRGCSFTEGNPNPLSSGVNSCGGDPVGVVYVGQALTNCQVPAFREWSFDAKEGLLDYSQYWFARDEKDEMIWPLQYEFSKVYGEEAILSSPAWWESALQAMDADEDLFEEFVQRRGLIDCKFGDSCHVFMMCNYLHGGEQITREFFNCLYGRWNA
mmetsp:Transcript_22272/g.46286  ORF Transcript_22272/g.46286 Transcript_22272/m.46286 type:complete len:438 (+) Transcript_22272:141-1454(+)|eukprot:CAMPEP_0118640956 /NCGR_PEP_ID=MMETSP0785-20121206/5022_1 /TAXON_ID=91992 /ORGANISM="Bolidomonas pacifica, Strain CCMP 1866" /LENGTH=437 /DNA_ID=CAMNT_0006532363 /DNA_START=2577 /DNA_END=3890 /DNA_ORIENTATION=-